jgi:hypothetical protein
MPLTEACWVVSYALCLTLILQLHWRQCWLMPLTHPDLPRRVVVLHHLDLLAGAYPAHMETTTQYCSHT